jgi:hypothetical protein
MRHALKLLTAGGVALGLAVAAESAPAQWGPWGVPGAAAYGPPVARYEGRRTLYGPFGPSGTEIRRMERADWYGPTMPPGATNPFGPSPTDIRRLERQMYFRSLGLPY